MPDISVVGPEARKKTETLEPSDPKPKGGLSIVGPTHTDPADPDFSWHLQFDLPEPTPLAKAWARGKRSTNSDGKNE